MARRLEDWINSYMLYTAVTEAPDSFHFWTAVWTIAGALRQKVYFDMGHFKWTPNFYVILVAPPGIANKSTTASIGERLLREVPGVHFGPNSLTWQSMMDVFAESCVGVEIVPGAFESQSCVTFCSSELGSLINFKDPMMVNVFTDLWDGHHQTWDKQTRMAGREVTPNPWINIMACTTPAWIADNMPMAIIGGGFTSRCIFVYADKKRRFIPYPKKQREAFPPGLREDLVADLRDIAALKGEFRLTPEAEAFGESWYLLHYENAPKNLDPKEFGGYIARKQCHVHKLAMIMSAAQSGSLVIELKHLSNAVTIVSDLEFNMSRVYGTINQAEGSERLVRLLACLKRFKRLTKSGLYRTVLKEFPRMSDFNDALNSIVTAGYARLEQQGDSLFVIATDKLFDTLDAMEGSPAEVEIPSPPSLGS